MINRYEPRYRCDCGQVYAKSAIPTWPGPESPAEWPEGFDSESRDSDRTAVDPLEPPIRPSERAAVLDGLQRLARSLESRPDPRRPNNPVHRSPLEILAEAEARAKTLPAPRLSAWSLAKLGLVDRPSPEHGELDAWVTEEAF